MTIDRRIRLTTTMFLIAALAWLAGYAQAGAPAQQVSTVSHTTKAPGWANMLPQSMRRPCKYEDSVNCYWDAGSAGNHRGHSFVVRQFPGRARMICVMYVRKADARRWDYCEATA